MSEVKRLWAESGYIQPTLAGARFRPATADEIKQAHPKCATCAIWEGDDDMPEAFCDYVGMRMLRTDYCHRHTPKDGDEGGQG